MKLVKVTRRRSGRGILHFENGKRIDAPLQVLEHIDIETEESYQLSALEADLREQCREVLSRVARRYLSRYSKSKDEFFEHFHRKGYPEDLLQDYLSVLREEGFLDDERVARQHVTKRLDNKMIGRRKLLAELREKGIDSDLAQKVIQENVDREKEREMAADYARNHSDLSERQLVNRLKSRGFPTFVIREAVDRFS